MPTPIGEAGCAFRTEHGLIIAGGTSGSDILGTNAVINTRDGETFEDLPPMPVAKVEHCLVALTDNQVDRWFPGLWPGLRFQRNQK